MTPPYPFDFIFVPRIASNRKKVRFGEVAIPKQISALVVKIREKYQNIVLICNSLCTCPKLLSNFH
jgi:hypothetical protein